MVLDRLEAVLRALWQLTGAEIIAEQLVAGLVVEILSLSRLRSNGTVFLSVPQSGARSWVDRVDPAAVEQMGAA